MDIVGGGGARANCKDGGAKGSGEGGGVEGGGEGCGSEQRVDGQRGGRVGRGAADLIVARVNVEPPPLKASKVSTRQRQNRIVGSNAS